MRSTGPIFGLLALLAVPVVVPIGCSWVNADQCWPNSSAGFGGSAPIPIGAGVGATSGDFLSPPQEGPANGATPNPCVTPEEPTPAMCQGGNAADDGATLTLCSSDCSGSCTSGVNGPFGASIFKFVTIVADDGTSDPGGWQEATANLRIVRINVIIPETWFCPVKVGMPLRTTVNGTISSGYAASVSAEIANKAATKVRREEPDLPQGIFCLRIYTNMKSFFSSDYKTLGARVN